MAQQDIFLKVTGQRAGVIKGESPDAKHKDEIEILGFTWGMQARADAGTGQASGRRSHRDLVVTKNVDRASTALMSALTTNEELKEVCLAVRKAGKSPLEYLKIRIERARLTNVQLRPDPADPAHLLEEISMTYQKITVEYVPQGADGQPQGSTTFHDEWTLAL